MRDIIFKGKRKDNSEWVEGYLFDDGMVDSKRMFIGSLVITEHKGLGEDVWDIGHAFYEVLPETVGQYTGLLDKDGKKVFECDIIKDLGGSMDGIPRVVIWNEAWMEFETYLVKSHWAYGTNHSRLWLMRNREIEVIGNIHDNPELLEVN